MSDTRLVTAAELERFPDTISGTSSLPDGSFA